jgi:hypothetical protein
MRVIEYKDEVEWSSHKVGSLIDFTYHDLTAILGEPLFKPEDSGDGKVQYEWVVEFKGKQFHIYDWKTWDEEYTKNELTWWSIGSKDSSWLGDFEDHLIGLKSKIRVPF